MGYVPEDRHHEGIVPSFSVKENLVLKDLAEERFSRARFLRLGAIDRNADRAPRRASTSAARSTAARGRARLSGGNIQKVILARELSRGPRALVAVYPTRGVDMGAAEFIHGQLLALRAQGTGILLVSEELEELTEPLRPDRGRLPRAHPRVLPARTATRERLGHLMAGVAA